jgi:hypothetical protein
MGYRYVAIAALLLVACGEKPKPSSVPVTAAASTAEALPEGYSLAYHDGLKAYRWCFPGGSCHGAQFATEEEAIRDAHRWEAWLETEKGWRKLP